jgi:hypothetical protein
MVKECYLNLAREEFEKVLISFFEKHKLPVISPRLLNTLKLPGSLNTELNSLRKYYDDGRNIPNIFINIDGIGTGAGVIDTLIHENYPVNTIEANSSALDINQFINRRIEDYWNLRRLFIEGKIDISDEELREELLATKYGFVARTEKMYLISKDEIKKEIGRSPDKLDSLVFASIDESMGNLDVLDINPDLINKSKRKKVSNSNKTHDTILQQTIILSDDDFVPFDISLT